MIRQLTRAIRQAKSDQTLSESAYQQFASHIWELDALHNAKIMSDAESCISFFTDDMHQFFLVSHDLDTDTFFIRQIAFSHSVNDYVTVRCEQQELMSDAINTAAKYFAEYCETIL